MPASMCKRVAYHALPDTVVVACTFQPQGAGAVTTVNAHRCTVARTGVGQYTVTFDTAWTLAQIVGLDAHIQMAALTDLKLQPGVFTVAATGSTWVFTAIAVAAATEIAANANNSVFIAFTINPSTVPS